MKRSKGEKAFNIFNIIILSLLIIITIYPFWYTIVASFSLPSKFMVSEGVLVIPKGFTLMAYDVLSHNPNVIIGYKNTIINTVLGTSLSMVLTILGAFVLSRKKLLMLKPITFLITITMFINAGIIPLFMIVRNLGMINTRAAQILPTAISVWNLIVLRSGFENIPNSLEEAAYIDGASNLTVLWNVIIPLSQATISVLVLFYAASQWNEWFSTTMYVQNRKLFTLQIIVREILIDSATSEGTIGGGTSIELSMINQTLKYALIVVSSLPVMLVYPFIQKYFTKGVMVGGIKE